MRQQDFDYLRELLKDRSGLVLSTEKVYLVESRLMPVARRRGYGGLDDLVSAVREGKDALLLVEITDAMTTNESFFFRDIKPFESLRDVVLPQLMEARGKVGKRRLRIWCAACSSGQEPYSVGMVLKENASKLQGFEFEIVATDLSTEIIEKARTGLYTQFEVQRGLPIQLLVKYFKQIGEQWQIDLSLRGMVDFRNFNLLDDYGGLGEFDVVFCRNVLIYFDQPTKSEVLKRTAKAMAADGVLYLGGAESVLGISEAFKPMPGQRGVYVVNNHAPNQAPVSIRKAG